MLLLLFGSFFSSPSGFLDPALPYSSRDTYLAIEGEVPEPHAALEGGLEPDGEPDIRDAIRLVIIVGHDVVVGRHLVDADRVEEVDPRVPLLIPLHLLKRRKKLTFNVWPLRS